MFEKLEPKEVFTPRNHEINKYSHVSRLAYINELERVFDQGKHIFIHGESGAGKSWLFKDFIKHKKIPVLTCNLANASKFGSIDAEFQNTVNRELKSIKLSFTNFNEISGEGAATFGDLPFFTALKLRLKLTFKQSKQTAYKILSKEPFEAALEFIAKKTRKKQKAVIVLDNFESIVGNEKLLKELADILTLLDDPRYGKYRVTIFIIGTPDDILYYFSNTPANQTISNRLSTIKEVSQLTDQETKALFDRGFGHLKYTVNNPENILKHIIWITDKIPQRIQEYCFFLATIAKEDKVISPAILQETDMAWLKDSLYQSYSAIENAMNSKETSIGRRNQTLYCLQWFGKKK